jgi:predicted dehydrogenase
MLIEKPIAADLDGAARIVRAVRESGVRAMPAYNLRHNPVSLAVKDLVDGGGLGRIARVRRLHGHALYEFLDFDGTRVHAAFGWKDPETERWQSLFFAGAHAALWFQWMFGSPESVQCMTTTVTRDLEAEDNATVVLRYADGFIGTIETSETLLTQGAVVEIYGTDGVLIQRRGNLPSTRVMNSDVTPLWLFDRKRNSWSIPALPPHFLRHELPYSSAGQFLQALLEDADVPTNVVDGFDALAILIAAEVAAAERRETAVERWSSYDAASSR